MISLLMALAAVHRGRQLIAVSAALTNFIVRASLCLYSQRIMVTVHR